jgi:hypothetical protein
MLILSLEAFGSPQNSDNKKQTSDKNRLMMARILNNRWTPRKQSL